MPLQLATAKIQWQGLYYCNFTTKTIKSIKIAFDGTVVKNGK
jgi:hypothetical protein